MVRSSAWLGFGICVIRNQLTPTGEKYLSTRARNNGPLGIVNGLTPLFYFHTPIATVVLLSSKNKYFAIPTLSLCDERLGGRDNL